MLHIDYINGVYDKKAQLRNTSRVGSTSPIVAKSYTQSLIKHLKVKLLQPGHSPDLSRRQIFWSAVQTAYNLLHD